MASAANHKEQDSQAFAERVRLGARNAVRCMGVTERDRVFILTDYARGGIAREVAAAVLAEKADVTVRFLEHYGTRPLTAFPDEMRNDLLQTRPTVSYYIAISQPGEIGMRIPLLPFLAQELKVRHGHMIGIDEQLMADGMCADYDEVFELTNRVYELVRDAGTIHVTSARGSDVTATFRKDWKWIPCHGRYHEQGKWGNLPEGEVFTAPANLNGVLVCDVLGDYFSEKYGVLQHPLTIRVKDGYVTEVNCEDVAIAQEVRDYLFSVPNGNRAGEFAIGTLASLKQLVGNLLQDEKMPGLHVAFGNPYPQFTGADWDARIHVDVIPSRCTIEVDGRVIMRDGQFVI
ncbi:MAG: aminopeptidase [Ktedonobacteraceae bacterium]|nr:aminopeptidase [Ktedonobacteraceae bacterium]MBO0793044.1 aminopeptidase [Ktedonobacteraceae bacterium]